MLPIKHILFPVDFSNRCCAAAPFIAAVAGRFGAKVTMLSVANYFLMPASAIPGARWSLIPKRF